MPGEELNPPWIVMSPLVRWAEDGSGGLRNRGAPHWISWAGKFETAKLISVLELERTWLAAQHTARSDQSSRCKSNVQDPPEVAMHQKAWSNQPLWCELQRRVYSPWCISSVVPPEMFIHSEGTYSAGVSWTSLFWMCNLAVNLFFFSPGNCINVSEISFFTRTS